MKQLKKNAERGEKLTHFIPGAMIPALDLGTDFHLGHSHMKSIFLITLAVNLSLFSQCSFTGEFGHCEPSPSVGRVTI